MQWSCAPQLIELTNDLQVEVTVNVILVQITKLLQSYVYYPS